MSHQFWVKNTIRLYNEKYHPLFDLDDGIKIIKDSASLNQYLKGKRK